MQESVLEGKRALASSSTSLLEKAGNTLDVLAIVSGGGKLSFDRTAVPVRFPLLLLLALYFCIYGVVLGSAPLHIVGRVFDILQERGMATRAYSVAGSQSSLSPSSTGSLCGSWLLPLVTRAVQTFDASGLAFVV